MNTITPVSSSAPPLRILTLLNLEWNRHLGAARVYMELNERWRAAGHVVEHFSFSEAFPTKHRSAREFAMRRILFPHKAASFVRANAARFDLVDALIGSLSKSKRQLGFNGLLVARSVGSHRLYDRFERSIQTRWPGRARDGSLAGKIFHSTVNRWMMAASDAALRRADVINVPNTEEAAFLRDECGIGRSIIVQPYGLAAEHHHALSSAARRPVDRLNHKTISFVGMWAPRKGSRIWGEIVRRVRQRISDVHFRFLGTMVSPEVVLRDIGVEFTGCVESVPEFSPDKLPALLADCAVGAFPSYVEGFGLAIIEQLAAGIPTVSFDEGGPRDILRENLPELLVPTGDIETFANVLVRTLSLPPANYERLVQASIKTAEQFSWSEIARDTLQHYWAAINRIGG